MTSRTMDAVYEVPTLSDVLGARLRIGTALPRTPLYRNVQLSNMFGASIWVKHENHLPTGAFKVRGGINLMSQLTAEERRNGVAAASTGNHGQSIAYAARIFGVPACIFVPDGANRVKVEAIQSFGADVVHHGRDFDEARVECERVARERGMRYVHSGNEPWLIAGVATATLEVIEEQPEIEVIIVAVGGGSGAAGACIVAKSVRPSIRVIGVQSNAAPAAYLSWKERRLVDDRMQTFAEGLATRTAFELPQRILWRHLDDFVLVSDDELRRATIAMIDATRNLVEPSGAAPLAAALRMREQLAGHRVALVCSGGNITTEQLRALLTPD